MALLQVNFFSNVLKRNVPMNVILPIEEPAFGSGKGDERTEYKTLYLLHGLTDNYMDWLCNTRIRQYATSKKLAVVMPSGDNSFYIDLNEPNSNYGEFIGRELVEITRKMFPLSQKREDTFIAGQSMGGFGAIRNGLKYADTFSHIAAFSSAVHIFEMPLMNPEESLLGSLKVFGDLEKASRTEKNPRVVFENLKKNGGEVPRIYMSCGLQDDLLESNRHMKAYFMEQGVDLTYEEVEGGHTWKVWDEEMKKVLKWLPLK